MSAQGSKGLAAVVTSISHACLRFSPEILEEFPSRPTTAGGIAIVCGVKSRTAIHQFNSHGKSTQCQAIV